jgi:hypothetical protein
LDGLGRHVQRERTAGAQRRLGTGTPRSPTSGPAPFNCGPIGVFTEARELQKAGDKSLVVPPPGGRAVSSRPKGPETSVEVRPVSVPTLVSLHRPVHQKTVAICHHSPEPQPETHASAFRGGPTLCSDESPEPDPSNDLKIRGQIAGGVPSRKPSCVKPTRRSGSELPSARSVGPPLQSPGKSRRRARVNRCRSLRLSSDWPAEREESSERTPQASFRPASGIGNTPRRDSTAGRLR